MPALRRPSRLRVPRIGAWPRACAAGACLLFALSDAVGGTSHAASGTAAPVAIVVASRDLPAGHNLTRADLGLAQVPPAARPNGAAHDPEDLAGRRLAGPVTAREPITPTRLMGRDLGTGLNGGLVAATVPVQDAAAVELVRPGDRVDVLETARPPDLVAAPADHDPAVTVAASGARVLAVLPGADGAAGELVVAVSRSTAVRLTRDRSADLFTVVVVPP